MLLDEKHFLFILQEPQAKKWRVIKLRVLQEYAPCPQHFYETHIRGLYRYKRLNVFFFNPLTANNEISRLENLTFLWTWILRWVPRSFVTHASLCNTLSSNKQICPKIMKILAVKGLKDHLRIFEERNLFRITKVEFNLRASFL